VYDEEHCPVLEILAWSKREEGVTVFTFFSVSLPFLPT
jgi:hypothetical protein